MTFPCSSRRNFLNSLLKHYLISLLGSLRGYDGCCNKIVLCVIWVKCFATIQCWSRCTKYANCTFACLARMVFMLRETMKDLLLSARVVVRTSNIKIPCRRLADYVKTLHQKACCTCSSIIFFIQPIISLICSFDVAVVILNSLFYRPELLEARLTTTDMYSSHTSNQWLALTMHASSNQPQRYRTLKPHLHEQFLCGNFYLPV